MKHRATKNDRGYYVYRGFWIDRWKPYENSGYGMAVRWRIFIGDPAEVRDGWCETWPTLRDAKDDIDHMIETLNLNPQGATR